MTMAEQTRPAALRPLGALELFFSTRHSLGIYRCVSLSARYQIPSGTGRLEASLTSAVASVVQQQPMLRVGILGQDTPKATTFSHVTSIDLRNHIEWRSVSCETRDGYEAQVAETQAWLHDQLWPQIETRPPWRIIALTSQDGTSPGACVDVIFGFHHVLTDGVGAKEFHQHLLAALQDQGSGSGSGSPAEPAYELSFPDSPELPEPQEEVVPFTNSYPFLLRVAWDMLGPSFLKRRQIPPWAGKPVDFSRPYTTRIRPLDLAPQALDSLLKASRDHSSSLTATIHALVLTSLARRLPAEEASSFSCSTPISLRPWISPTANASLKASLRPLVTALATPLPGTTVAALRAPSASDDLVWQASTRIKNHLNERTAAIPRDDLTGLLPLVPDLFSYWRSRDGKPRDNTWEVSNVGVLRQESGGDDGATWKITRAMFSNGAMVAGAGMGFNTVSVAGGPLTIALSWQEGIVPDELVAAVVDDLSAFANRLHETGRFLG